MLPEHYVKQQFEQYFNYSPSLVEHAPGRVNLIGDHTDYNDGFVLPAAINFATFIAASRRDDQKIRVVALDYANEYLELDLANIRFDPSNMWVNYISGTVQALMTEYPTISGADLVITGTVPQGAGLSSSASFEIAILKTFARLNDISLSGVQAALMGQQAENNFVGCNCGIMDQLISALGQADHAMLLDCRDLRFQHAPIPDNISLLIVNSNVKRGLVDSEYNTRRAQCEQVAKFFAQTALRDVTLDMLQQAETQLDTVLFKRAKHVITENIRTQAAMIALEQGNIATLSRLMAESHASLKEDFAVTTVEVDYLVELIASKLSDKGGVRMTGGGFGGCIIAVLPTAMVDNISQVITDNYQKHTGLAATIYLCHAVNGAFHNASNHP